MAISLKESIVVGFSDFWSRKIRSIVTIIGIVLGTMSVIVVLSLMNGVNQKTIQWMLERGGLNKISIYQNWEYQSKTGQRKYFTYRELKLIHSLIPEVKYFNPTIRRGFRISYGKKEYWTSVRGVYPDFSPIEEWGVQKGRFVSNFDINQSSDIIVIGTKVAEELFGNLDPLGKMVTVHNRRLQVAGVMEHRFMKNSVSIGNDNNNALSYLNRRAFIPLSTMINKITNQDKINGLALKTSTPEEAILLKDKLEGILSNLRRREPVFIIESAQEEAEKAKKNTKIFQIIFFIISLISLLVGGIVIINIMLATIQERTREIGIRLAVGARRRDIFIQFLVQTVIITLLGGIIGVTIGVSILGFISNFLKMELIASFGTIILSVAVSAGIGLIFGIIPAIHASNLNPVEALRHE